MFGIVVKALAALKLFKAISIEFKTLQSLVSIKKADVLTGRVW